MARARWPISAGLAGASAQVCRALTSVLASTGATTIPQSVMLLHQTRHLAVSIADENDRLAGRGRCAHQRRFRHSWLDPATRCTATPLTVSWSVSCFPAG